jgi:hypothetical protein
MKNMTLRLAALAALAVAIGLASCGGGSAGGSGSSAGGGGNGAADTSNPSPSSASGLPACPAGNQLFTVTPLALEQVRGWEPLGHMGPPAHTFPTDHQYLYSTAFGQSVDPLLSIPVVAPANIRVTQLFRSTYAGGSVADYSVFFQPCADVLARFGHVVTLPAELLAAAGPIDKFCSTYEPSPGHPTTLCQSAVFRYDIAAGQAVGTLGHGGSISLDWWLQDRRVAALHFADTARFAGYNGSDGFDEAHIVPASSYYTPAVAAQIAGKLGRFDGAVQRTTEPTGGTIAVDVDGTARGYWFNPAQPYPPEAFHAALAPDYVTPTSLQVFSLGLSQGNAAVYATFVPSYAGTVNRAFETVVADGQVYCWEPLERQNVILAQLIDATTLKLEVRPGVAACTAAEASAFSANAVVYKR